MTTSLVPVKPFPDPPPDPPAIEIDEFVGDKGSLCDTFDSYINNIYIYPLSLKYEHQKAFAKVRDIYRSDVNKYHDILHSLLRLI